MDSPEDPFDSPLMRFENEFDQFDTPGRVVLSRWRLVPWHP